MIDFSPLTDDQLVEMARELTRELIRRNPAVLAAAQGAIREETEAARASQDFQWARKKWIGSMVKAVLGEGWHLNVWKSDANEVRVYLENTPSDRRGRDRVKACLYVTGGRQYPPASLTFDAESRATKPDAAIACLLMKAAAETWPAGEKINCDLAASTKYDIPAFLPEISKAIAIAQRDEYRREAERACHSKVPVWRSNMSPEETLARDEARKAADEELAAMMAAYDLEKGLVP